MISPKTSDLCPLFSKHDALHLLFLTKSLFSDKRWLANQELVFPDVIGRRVWHFRRNVPPQHHTSTKIGSSVQLLLIFTCRLIESNRACINFHKNIYKSTTDWLHHSEDCHLENLKLAVEKSGKHWVTQEIPVDEIYSQLWCIFPLQKKKKKTKNKKQKKNAVVRHSDSYEGGVLVSYCLSLSLTVALPIHFCFFGFWMRMQGWNENTFQCHGLQERQTPLWSANRSLHFIHRVTSNKCTLLLQQN